MGCLVRRMRMQKGCHENGSIQKASGGLLKEGGYIT